MEFESFNEGTSHRIPAGEIPVDPSLRFIGDLADISAIQPRIRNQTQILKKSD
jgi:hypothetical protein